MREAEREENRTRQAGRALFFRRRYTGCAFQRSAQHPSDPARCTTRHPAGSFTLAYICLLEQKYASLGIRTRSLATDRLAALCPDLPSIGLREESYCTLYARSLIIDATNFVQER